MNLLIFGYNAINQDHIEAVHAIEAGDAEGSCGLLCLITLRGTYELRYKNIEEARYDFNRVIEGFSRLHPEHIGFIPNED